MNNYDLSNDNHVGSDEKLRAEICPTMSEHKRRLRRAYVDNLASRRLTIADMVGISPEMVRLAVVKLKFENVERI